MITVSAKEYPFLRNLEKMEIPIYGSDQRVSVFLETRRTFDPVYGDKLFLHCPFRNEEVTVASREEVYHLLNQNYTEMMARPWRWIVEWRGERNVPFLFHEAFLEDLEMESLVVATRSCDRHSFRFPKNPMSGELVVQRIPMPRRWAYLSASMVAFLERKEDEILQVRREILDMAGWRVWVD